MDDETELVNERADEIYERSVYTKRQAEVLALEEAGYSRVKIARELGVSTQTVDQHFRNAQERLEEAAWTVMASDVIVFSVRTGQGSKMLADMDSILELRGTTAPERGE